jgi:hypothetical protein
LLAGAQCAHFPHRKENIDIRGAHAGPLDHRPARAEVVALRRETTVAGGKPVAVLMAAAGGIGRAVLDVLSAATRAGWPAATKPR